MSLSNVFHDALIYGLEILGLSDIELKEKQHEALKMFWQFSGADPGFLLRGSAPLRNDVTIQDFS